MAETVMVEEKDKPLDGAQAKQNTELEEMMAAGVVDGEGEEEL